MAQVRPDALERCIQLSLHPCIVNLEALLAPTTPGDLAKDTVEGIAYRAGDGGARDGVYGAATNCPDPWDELDQLEYHAPPNHRAVDPAANLLLLDHG